jgi:hypothetical protein
MVGNTVDMGCLSAAWSSRGACYAIIHRVRAAATSQVTGHCDLANPITLAPGRQHETA